MTDRAEPEDRRAPLDLRSDTVTRPTPGMRRAMAAAEVGDDILDGDPTTRRLERRVAELLGREEALFFPSGLMANQAALAILGRPGTEVLLEADAHIVHWEEAAAAQLSGLQLRPVPTPDGMLDADRLSSALRPSSRYLPRATVAAFENTHLASGGRAVDPGVYVGAVDVARRAGLATHLDGARLWHAAVALGVEEAELARGFDTVMVSLSKGLGAPVGAVLTGSRVILEEAWRVRRRFGGGMRQTGMLAAAGLHALDHHREALALDHDRARELARRAAEVPGLRVVPPETNIVLLDLPDSLDPARVVEGLRERGVLMVPFGRRRLRAVLHRDVGDGGIERAAEALVATCSG